MLFLPGPTAFIEEKKISNKEKITFSNEKSINSEQEKFDETIEIDWMLKKTDAENDQMIIWANAEYKEALKTAKEAKSLKKIKDYINSEKYFTKAIKQIDVLLDNKEIILKKILDKGNKFFAHNDLIKAKEEYINAQSIDKENKLIIRKLERIERREEVISLLLQSQELEKNMELDEAIKTITKALEIEPEYGMIKEQLKYLIKKKRNNDFDIAVNMVLEALEKRNFSNAEKKLKIVKDLKANNSIIQDLEMRVKKGFKDQKIYYYKKLANRHEENEQWLMANENYNKILEIDADINEIIYKKQRVKGYIKLNKLLNNIVSKPERLQNDQIFHQSKKSLEFIKLELSQNNNFYYKKLKTPILYKKIIIAEDLIKKANTIINVTLKSDNKTEITLYRVKKLGKLIEKNITLRPGNYTIVGSKAGYRDFRKNYKIKASDKNVIIYIQCKDKI